MNGFCKLKHLWYHGVRVEIALEPQLEPRPNHMTSGTGTGSRTESGTGTRTKKPDKWVK